MLKLLIYLTTYHILICCNNDITRKTKFFKIEFENVLRDSLKFHIIFKCDFGVITDCRGVKVSICTLVFHSNTLNSHHSIANNSKLINFFVITDELYIKLIKRRRIRHILLLVILRYATIFAAIL